MRIAYETRLARIEGQVSLLLDNQRALSDMLDKRLGAMVSWVKPVVTTVVASIVLGILVLVFNRSVPPL